MITALFTSQATDTKGFSKVVDYFELSKVSSIERQEDNQLSNIFIFRRHVHIKKTNGIDNLCQSYFLPGGITAGILYITK